MEGAKALLWYNMATFKEVRMAVCVPVREMKDTAKFLSTVEDASGPVTVTRNGRDALIAMTPDVYDGLLSELAHERLMRRLDRAEAEFAAGEYVDGPTFMSDVLENYGE